MTAFHRLIASIPNPLIGLLCLTLGLAPFLPEPHLWQKLKMLFAGDLTRSVDIFDFLMHAAPFLLLFLKLALGPPPPR